MRKFVCGLSLARWHRFRRRRPILWWMRKFFTPPPGMATIGDTHGDIAVSPAGEIYVSVQGGDHPESRSIAQGRYLRNVPGAPPDLHGFIIAAAPDRQFYIYGVSRLAQEIIQLKLDGTRV
jgi:hypothetical protein